MNSIRLIAGLTIAFVVPALAPTAFAGEPQGSFETQRTVVAFQTLDLNREPDARAALRRLRVAASKVCRRPDRTLSDKADSRPCRDAALADAVKKLDRPMVTAVYIDGRTPVVVAAR